MFNELKEQLISTIENSLKELYPDAPAIAVTLEIPQDKQFGELASTAPLRLAGPLKKNPLQIGASLQAVLERRVRQELKGKIEKIEVRKPGFVNFYLTKEAFQDCVAHILKEGDSFGRSKQGAGRKVQIEFVSANPTGPLSVAHARQAAVGDALGNILTAVGFDVTKEFYVNDEGNQINILGRSICDRAREILGETFPFPEDNYQGEYIKDMAKEFMSQHHVKTFADLTKIEAAVFSQYGVEVLMDVIKKELSDFGVHFDVWSYQSKMATVQNIEKVLQEMRKRGYIYDHEGAVWFKSTELGDDKDRVVKKTDGSFTYLAPDIVYHKNKFERGFSQVVNLWGPDHHGYIPRLKAAVAALGYDPKSLVVLIVQLATIFRDGKPLSMSTRRGQYISLREVMDEVGVDAARFFFLMRHIKAHLEFDLELAKKETPENPVYYVQYAHARIHSVLDVAKEKGVSAARERFSLLTQPEELDLIKELNQFPEILSTCAQQLEPYPLLEYLPRLATGFHRFYDKHRIVGEEARLSEERLGLLLAARIVLANGLKVLGVKAPVKM